jgi:uncharacterized membrane-anchored protein YitT (DUF2179 family)
MNNARKIFNELIIIVGIGLVAYSVTFFRVGADVPLLRTSNDFERNLFVVGAMVIVAGLLNLKRFMNK